MSIEKVKQYLAERGADQRIREFSVSSATVELAAEALGCEPCRIAKSLAFLVDGKPVLVVAAGDARIDNRRFKDTFGVKATMIPREDTGKLIGHAAGGVCPFALNEGVTVYLDESLRRFDLVYPACGSSNSAIGLTLEELELFSSPGGWVSVTRLPET
jgi:prolyl-tRNA editing enzyme YbaK/EbsC (Cys-tRNA(Pro) deacylase)